MATQSGRRASPDRGVVSAYQRRPTRWRDVPRHSEDVFLPVLTPWVEGERKVSAIEACYRRLPTTWDGAAEDHIFDTIFDVFRHRRFHAMELPPIPPTVSEALADATNLTIHLAEYDADYPVRTYDEIVDCVHPVPELEALLCRTLSAAGGPEIVTMELLYQSRGAVAKMSGQPNPRARAG